DQNRPNTLTAAHKKLLKARDTGGPGGPPGPGPGPGGAGAPPPPGQILSATTLTTLKLNPDQRKQLGDLQKEVDARLDKTLQANQKRQLKKVREDFVRGGPPGAGPGGPPGGGPGPGPPGPGGPGNGLFAGPPGGASLFRAYRYGPEYPGLAGKDLKPGKTIEELEKEPEKQ
ncbi:MAG: hypothetical protein ACHRXM_09090, partial [Isosphaerales bacterium]